MSFPTGAPIVLRGAILGRPVQPARQRDRLPVQPGHAHAHAAGAAGGGGAAAGGGDRSEALRLRGAPMETIRVAIEIDATDQLERPEADAVSLGIYPQLSALEMLVYPSSAEVLANTVALAAGTIEVVPPEAPLTLFAWGPSRVLPVRVNEFSIAEQSYDQQLNPIRASVSLGLRVLSYNDLPLGRPGRTRLFLAHQVVKEAHGAQWAASAGIADPVSGQAVGLPCRTRQPLRLASGRPSAAAPGGRPVRCLRRRFMPPLLAAHAGGEVDRRARAIG